MYLSYYNLKAKPFQMSTDPAFLWLGEKHKEALAILKYAILENKGVLALTGDVGTGKTTLINALLKSLGKDTITATIYDPRLNVIDFFNTVASAFKIKKTFKGKGQFILQFMEFLIKVHEQNKKVLLIIDESQAINENLLEEIRLLSNLEAEYTRLMNIFFVGQNEFIDILQKYENRALRQRVTIRYHIDPLSLNETAAYVDFRLKVAGTQAPIFDSGAIDEIYSFSGGYPRLINIMCDHALLSGYVREVQVINAQLIRECREELLVSKKAPENDFQYANNDFRSLSSHDFQSPPSNEYRSQPNHDFQPSPSNDFRSLQDETMFAEPQEDSFDPVEDFINRENEQMAFKPAQPMMPPPRYGKPPKKRFFQSTIAIVFLLIVGIIGGYSYYSSDKDTAKSLVPLSENQDKTYVSEEAGSKNDKSPNRFETGKVGENHFFNSKSPNSSLGVESISKEDEAPLVIASKNLPESDGNDKTTETHAAGVSSGSQDSSLSADTVPSDPTRELPLMVPITEKAPDKIKEPASNSVQKAPETITTKSVKPVEEPVTDASIPKPVLAQKNTSQEYTAKLEVNKKKEPESFISKNDPPRKEIIVPEKKAEPPRPVAKEKKAVGGADKQVASKQIPASKSKTKSDVNFTQINLDDRLNAFLDAYCRTYEQKDLDKFSSFFALNAVEKGKPFRSWLPKYRQIFNRVDLIEYDIQLERYATQQDLGLIKIDGIFNVRAKLVGSKEWRTSSGPISMVLEADRKSFKVVELDY